MSIVRCKPLIHQWHMSRKPRVSSREQQRAKFLLPSPKNPFQATPNGYGLNIRLRSDSYHSLLRPIVEVKAAAQSPPLAETDLIFSETFDIERIKTTEGKVSVKLEPVAGNTYRWRLVIGCNIKGKWVLHWGVTYCDDLGCEWDQPPPEMRPPGSVQIKDYAVETPLSEISSSSEGQMSSVVQIEINGDTPIVAINFVLKEEEMGAWFQHKGRDFRIPLRGDSLLEANSFNGKPGFGIWPGPFEQISSMLLKSEEPEKETIPDPNSAPKPITEFQEQYTVLKQETVRNYLTVIVRKIEQNDQNALEFDTDNFKNNYFFTPLH